MMAMDSIIITINLITMVAHLATPPPECVCTLVWRVFEVDWIMVAAAAALMARWFRRRMDDGGVGFFVCVCVCVVLRFGLALLLYLCITAPGKASRLFREELL